MARTQRPAAAPDRAEPAAEVQSIADLVPDPQNRRRHTERNLKMITSALQSVGAGRSIVIDEDNVILSGNGVTEAAAGAGLTRVRVIETDGDELIAVRRRGLSAVQKRDLAIYDNRTAELAEWNFDQLEADKAAGLDLQPFWTPEEETAMASKAAADEIDQMSARTTAAASEETATGDDPKTFFCPLTVDQERIVRAALRAARLVYGVATVGDALTAALQDWAEHHKAAPDASHLQ